MGNSIQSGCAGPLGAGCLTKAAGLGLSSGIAAKGDTGREISEQISDAGNTGNTGRGRS